MELAAIVLRSPRGAGSTAACLLLCGYDQAADNMETKVVEAGVSRDGASDFCVQWESTAMRGIQSLMAEIASADIPILVVGEPGSGKEAIAVQIHRLSPRRNSPLRKVGCSARSLADLDLLLQAESVRGAGSTVLLDEIGELDYICQARLMELLSSAGSAPLGGDRHAWVATTCCQNLEAEVRAGRFREDVYYRIGAVSLRLPPLRQRQEDIPGLTSFFLAKYAAAFGRPRLSLSDRALRVFESYCWPGNIRELENTAKRIVALGDERVPIEEIEPSLGKPPTQVYSLKQAARAASRQAEKELILKVLRHTKWNRKRAAQELQISYKALLYKLKQTGVGDSVA